MLYFDPQRAVVRKEIEYSMLFRWFVGLNLDEEVRMRPRSPRTVIGCWRLTWPKSSWRMCGLRA
jgi:hypothetical protein